MYFAPRPHVGDSHHAAVCDRFELELANRGEVGDYVRRHESDCVAARQPGTRERRTLANELLRRIAPPTNVYLAAMHLQRIGGPAAGPNGLCLAQLEREDVWGLATRIAEVLSRGRFHATNPKGSNPDSRCSRDEILFGRECRGPHRPACCSPDPRALLGANCPAERHIAMETLPD